MHCRRALFVSSCVIAFAGIAAASEKFGNADAITVDRLRAHLEFIASDELEGRNTPSKGLDIAAKYLAAQLKLYGLKPMGDNGTYFQKIPLRRPTVSASGSSATLGGTSLTYGEQFYASPTSGNVEGQVVYVGSGWQVAGGTDPYAKVDVKDKIVLAVEGRPEGVTFRDQRSGKATSPQAAALKLGAKGVILVTSDTAGWEGDVRNSTAGGRARMGLEAPAPSAPTITVKVDALAGLLQGESMTMDDLKKRIADKKLGEGFALAASKTVKFTVAADDNTIYTQNVIAAVEGSDPKLKSEYVAVGAHYDHIGMRTRGTGDLINNGADDDGSGTVSVLEMSKAFQEGRRPKRSILFVWHTGEEQGLWGSQYFNAHPTVPLTSIVAQLNIDMIGRTRAPGDTSEANKMLAGPNSIYIVGTTRMSKDLGALALDVNKRLYNLKYDFTYDDLNHPEQIFFRSDHFNYALKGIPILFWFDGVHQDYHGVDDEIDKIDFNKMQQVARTVHATAWELANRKDRPKVDMPLPADLRRR